MLFENEIDKIRLCVDEVSISAKIQVAMGEQHLLEFCGIQIMFKILMSITAAKRRGKGEKDKAKNFFQKSKSLKT